MKASNTNFKGAWSDFCEWSFFIQMMRHHITSWIYQKYFVHKHVPCLGTSTDVKITTFVEINGVIRLCIMKWTFNFQFEIN